MKPRISIFFALFAILSVLSVPVHSVLACSGEAIPSQKKACISVANLRQDQVVPAKPVRLKLHIVPAPTSDNPVHVHIYVNDHMISMFTATSQNATVVLKHLRKGRNTITIVQANPHSHMEMTGSGSQGMSGMSGMSMMDDANASIAHITLIVK
jgi:hypothetical protein